MIPKQKQMTRNKEKLQTAYSLQETKKARQHFVVKYPIQIQTKNKKQKT